MKKPMIGIIGGMGPEASCYLYKLILSHYQIKYNAVQDNEYPHIIINNVSLDGFSEKGVEDEDTIKQGLLAGIQQLENAGVDRIFMACNTIHVYYDFLQENSTGKIINLVEQAVMQIQNAGLKDVLILGSHTTREEGLYDVYLEKYNIGYTKVSSPQQERIDSIIEHVMKDSVSSEDMQFIQQVVKSYNKDAAIIACTELPIVCKGLALGQTFDTLSILTQLVDDIDHLKL